MSNRQKYQYGLTFLVDIAALSCSVAASMIVFGLWLKRIIPYESVDYLQFDLALLLSFFASYACFDQAKDITTRGLGAEIVRSVKFVCVFGALLAVLLLIFKAPLLDSRYLFVGILGFDVILLPLFHQLLKKALCQTDAAISMAQLVGVLTTVDRAPALLKDLRGDWSKKVYGLALLDETGTSDVKEIEGVPVKATFDTFLEWVRRDSLDAVYLDVPYDTGASLLPYLRELESMGLDVHLNIPLLEEIYTKGDSAPWMPAPPQTVEHRGNSYMIILPATHHRLRDVIIKRAIDIVGSAVGLILSVPIIAITAIPLKLESPGPLFFKQKRVGLNGRIFSIYKLRSMYIDAEERKKELMEQNKMQGLMFKMDDDPRITKVGKFIRKTSIDELPQFWNVFCGQMSLVGTRPPTLDEYRQYESHHKRRLSMKPGITGMWQVSGRSNIQNFEDVVRMDVDYIDNWSLWLDVKILFKTVAVVFAGRGAE